MKSPLENFRQQAGLSYRQFASRLGQTLNKTYRHCTEGSIPAEYALRYEHLLGIPLHELRPDLWPAPEEESAPDSQEARDGTS